MPTTRIRLRPFAAPATIVAVAVGLAACAPQAGEPVPGTPASPIDAEQAGGPPPPLTPDNDPIERP